jgi:hypothetical protein
MTNLVSLVELSGLPPHLPLLADTIHTLGWSLLVALVVGPALALAGSVIRDALSGASAAEGESPVGRPACLCSTRA